MKWTAVGLSVFTIVIWGFVLLHFLDLDKNAYVYTAQHEMVFREKPFKNGNFIFSRNESTSNHVHASRSSREKMRLEADTVNRKDNETVPIDDILAVLELTLE